MKKIYAVLIIILISFSFQSFAKNILNSNDKLKGTWLGKLELPGQELRIVFNIKESKSGNLFATMKSPDQSPRAIPVDTVIYNNGNINLNVKIIHVYFEGKFSSDNLTITGNWHQGGHSLPLVLKKVNKVEEVREPQTTSPSSPYKTKDVSITVNGYKLNGTLEVPKSNKRVNVVLIIAGSGPTDRNGNSTLLTGKNNSLKMLADTLYNNGIASLRYDKRDVGANEKVNELNLTFDMFVHDAGEWVKFLRNDKHFSKIIIAGHSEGSLIGMIAARRANADMFISLCGAGRPTFSLIEEQLKNNNRLPEKLLNESKDIIDSLKQGYTVKHVNPSLRILFRPSVQPYIISWFKYNPVKEISKLSIPILIVEGTTDLQVDIKDADLLAHANKNAKLVIIKNMNHILKNVPTKNRMKNFQSYSNPDLSLSKVLCKKITEFINNN